jgi:ubiquinone/menaquinone biosynthesis C-methylase UbiE
MRLPETEEEVTRSGLRRNSFMEFLLRHTKPEGRLVDVGGGWGAFARHAKEKGFEPTVVELCKQAADYCRNNLGIPAYSQDVEEVPFDEKSAQALVSIHALEHLQNPDTALAAIRRILAPGGIFAGIVPNIESLASQIMAEKWIWLDPNNHLTYFAPDTLRKHVEQRGFSCLEMFTQTGDFGPENVRTALANQADRKVTDEELRSTIADANKAGWGEEIVFAFRRI